MTERCWKITVSSLYPNDTRKDNVYEGYHDHEDGARQAALTWEAIRHGGSTIGTIVKVEEVKYCTRRHAFRLGADQAKRDPAQ